MSIIATIFGGGVGKAIEAVGNIADDLITSDEERLRAELASMELQQRPAIEQARITRTEAAHRTMFVAGWRPAVGWVCAIGLFYHFILRPLIVWGIIAFNPEMRIPPNIDYSSLMTLVLSLCGLGGLRTYEKLKGVSK